MKSSSFLNLIEFGEDRVKVSLILESSFSKEIRITFKKGQYMKEHQTPYPIIVHLLEGKIDFGVNGEIHQLEKGSILTLEGGVPHDLLAHEDSIVRLTLSKLDTTERVEDVGSFSKHK